MDPDIVGRIALTSEEVRMVIRTLDKRAKYLYNKQKDLVGEQLETAVAVHEKLVILRKKFVEMYRGSPSS